MGIAISASPRRVVALRFKAKGGSLGAAAAIDDIRVQEGSLKAGETVTYDRTLAFGPLAAKPIKTDDATVQRLSPKALAFDEIAKASEGAWKKRWQSDIEIDGPVEDEQAVRSFLFYLRSSIAPEARRAIAPMALSSEIYGGARLLGRGYLGLSRLDADGPGPRAGDPGVPDRPRADGVRQRAGLGHGPPDGDPPLGVRSREASACPLSRR